MGRNFLNLSLYEFKSTLDETQRDKTGFKKMDELSEDMKYFDNLIKKIDELGGNSNVTKEASNAINFLSDRKEFWSQHKVQNEK